MKKQNWKLVEQDGYDSRGEPKFKVVETYYGNQKQLQEHCIKKYQGRCRLVDGDQIRID